jgi:catechol 2,3-dioxygenase-like lactoylglutathione lyase family enzyme
MPTSDPQRSTKQFNHTGVHALNYSGGRLHWSKMKVGAAQPILIVENIEASVDFYREKLGFSCPVVSDGYAVVRRDSLEIHLMPAHRNGLQVNPNNACKSAASDVYVVVDDLEALYREFTGLNIVRGPETYQDTSREFVVEDLNGYWICFSQEFKPWRDG